MTALQNKVVQLNNIMPCYSKEYTDVLFEAKESKAQAMLNRVSNDSPNQNFFSYIFNKY